MSTNINDFIRTKTRGRYANIVEMPQEEGGFGRLYRARDTKRGNTDVCIKVIKSNLTKDLQMKLWHDEVTALERYRYRSGIVHLVDEQYEFSEDEPYVFLVMDYVHGNRLGASKYRIELNVDEDEAILLIFQLCSVIFSIHQRGDYHQDIFPDNIKIQGSDLFLLDLGGMREAERRSGTIIFGGEMYSPPEVSPTRLRMKRFRTLRKHKMGSFESADIFSIGAILYELLMGVPFFESIDQSNHLKEYIYDYYTSDELVQDLRKEYTRAIDSARKNRENLEEFLHHYAMPPELCRALASTLEIYPPKRPSIDELLNHLFPYLIQRAADYYDRRQWERATLWVTYLERHFREVRQEIAHENVFLSDKLRQHLLAQFPMYAEGSFIAGNSAFHAGQFDSAYQTFQALHTAFEEFRRDYAGQQRNSLFLKVMNNLAACHYQLSRKEEARHLFETLSTAPGKFGRIIDRNLRACAA